MDRVFPPDLSRVGSLAPVVVDAQGRTLSVLPAAGGVWRVETTASDVPPHLIDLLIAAEDARFAWHPGIDPVALARASLQWVRAGRVVSGGSTLSMQAARLLEPRPRTLRSKLIEMARALQLEARYGKAGVLRIWLTLAPMGGNLEGVRAGALAWFGREARNLDPAQSALLVAIPRRPEALRPDRHPAAARVARDRTLLVRAAGAEGISAADRALLAAVVPSARQPMPGLAPHLSREAAREGASRTTLDASLQRALEGLLERAREGLPGRVSTAAIIADLHTREIRALVGGAWGEEARAGALDLTQAVRSPGSAMKPLLYALAFEDGVARPDSLLDDAPMRFGAYAPENFDHGFTGRVTAAEALRKSLNMPAVLLLDRIGPLRFATAMKRAGAIPRLPPGAEATLPLALGGAGVTLREVVGVTAMLGDAGRAAPLRWRADDAAPAPAPPVLAPRAAAQVAAILTRGFPGGGPSGVAWKTGTSWGGRDSWAVGFDAGHVVGVWVGRPDGSPIVAETGGATGTQLALPLLARSFALLPAAPRAQPLVMARAGAVRNLAVAELGDRLRLVFPAPGASISDGPVTLRAAGGQRPLTFLVDGQPLDATPARRDTAWIPQGPGHYRVTVLDAAGASATAAIRVH
ncbi:penicillin-binding protein 1C [Roseomonas sp. USHLN139]|uniref:penicillin-binding protein 1C n=1 Tax=Roseomonas sp. USHLN139 TaxID=3081298 RepID=UPI003B017F0F